MTFTTMLLHILLVGLGAIWIMDLWGLLLQRLGVATLNYAMVGRLAGHALQGRLHHKSIVQASPVRNELACGWIIHYVTGLVFAAVLVGLTGQAWLSAPTLWPALAFGIVTVLLPLCLMQPAMGAGLFSSKTPTPLRNCIRSLATHTVFGIGLFVSATILLFLVKLIT
ncbi:DUF2938 domain-containing protein [Pseudomonas piscis]|uniref:DUF2938 domain-containing protein n=1 Tax=Pseudomonas piscis TaxID=2614538 RepID=UPI0021D5EF09|nr:DUF2938 domain-containing protein [Pseudomonas piscis]MCU7647376.1 DUF2938 domain-containing protein [Pseudomonas piscis]